MKKKAETVANEGREKLLPRMRKMITGYEMDGAVDREALAYPRPAEVEAEGPYVYVSSFDRAVMAE